jgi:hypothetical protein
MSERDERLHQFFAGYFNQDWDIIGAASWSDVMDEYLAHNTETDIIRTRDDLLSWLSDSEHAQKLLAAYGCGYDPGPDGMDERMWVAALAEYIQRKRGG